MLTREQIHKVYRFRARFGEPLCHLERDPGFHSPYAPKTQNTFQVSVKNLIPIVSQPSKDLEILVNKDFVFEVIKDDKDKSKYILVGNYDKLYSSYLSKGKNKFYKQDLTVRNYQERLIIRELKDGKIEIILNNPNREEIFMMKQQTQREGIKNLRQLLDKIQLENYTFI